jgi:hypothetical protein
MYNKSTVSALCAALALLIGGTAAQCDNKPAARPSAVDKAPEVMPVKECLKFYVKRRCDDWLNKTTKKVSVPRRYWEDVEPMSFEECKAAIGRVRCLDISPEVPNVRVPRITLRDLGK